MYTLRYEGGVMSNEQSAIRAIVPNRLNNIVRLALSIGDALISRWFGDDALPGGGAYADFHAKRQQMNTYLNEKCTVMTFVKKIYGAKVDSAEVEVGDYAQVVRSCFQGDGSGFVPSGIRVYLLGTGFINQDEEEQFNTIAHELSHRVIETTDNPGGHGLVYGKQEALDLAARAGDGSELAVTCAENWGYFYQEVMGIS